jgi:hypothetical protein
MNILNLTPHTITIVLSNDRTLCVEPSGIVARVAESYSQGKDIEVDIGSISVSYPRYGKILDLPEPQPDTIYIVSALVLQRTDRTDVYAPGKLVRDERGQPIGCVGLSGSGYSSSGLVVEQAYKTILTLSQLLNSFGAPPAYPGEVEETNKLLLKMAELIAS